MTATITRPGLYDLDAADYHGDPTDEGSLSQSRAKVLLDEGGPAKFHAALTEPRVEKREFDEGTAVHAVLLGKGGERLVHIDGDNYRTKAAQEARDAAYTAGKTPMLTHQRQAVEKIVAGIPTEIRDLFRHGQAEVSMFWRDPSGLWLRGQMDYYIPGVGIIDLKTMRDTTNRAFTRAVWDHRYYMQAAWYRRGVEALTGELLPYIVVGVEKTAPYLSRAKRITEDYLAVGEAHMDQAIATYLHCVETETWPGHPTAIDDLDPPPWASADLAASTITALETLIGDTP
jgi:hypothetical protein